MAQMTESSIDLDWYALSEQEIRQFDEQGYLIVRDVLDQDMIDRVVEAADRLIASDDQHMRTGRLGFKNCIVKDDAFILQPVRPNSFSVGSHGEGFPNLWWGALGWWHIAKRQCGRWSGVQVRQHFIDQNHPFTDYIKLA